MFARTTWGLSDARQVSLVVMLVEWTVDGTALIVRVAWPFTVVPVAVALMVAVPAASVVIFPAASTLAADSLLEAQTSLETVNGSPFSSWALAVHCEDCPAVTEAGVQLTVIELNLGVSVGGGGEEP